GAKEAVVLLEDGMPVHLTVVPEAAWFAALFVQTGSDAHVEAIAARAKERGFALKDDGLHEGQNLVRLEEEDDVYKSAGLSFVPPELRESEDATPAPEDLVSIRDVRGILHAHSTWSDGSYSIRQMAEHAAQSGFSWYASCDHSAAASYAHGLDAARLREQWAE